MIRFEVPKIHGKGRPRFRSTGQFVQTYTDDKTAEFENLVRLAFMNCGVKGYMDREALSVTIYAFHAIPKSTSKKQRALMFNGQILPTKKPDADNIAKSVLDALNKVAFNDDTQVVELLVIKQYALEEKLIVEIREVNEYGE